MDCSYTPLGLIRKVFRGKLNQLTQSRMFSFASPRRSLQFVSLSLVCIACNDQPTPEGFQIEPGFTLTRVAAEPLIKDPVDLEFNERGDALVLEMPGYPFEDKQSRLVVLKDGNQDGGV